MSWTFLLSLASDFLVSLAANLAYERGKNLPISLLPPLLAYKAGMRNRFREMPFIYRQLSSQVLDDYVGVEFRGLDSHSLQGRNEGHILRLSFVETLRNSTCVLFLGNAGAGKTTFQWHVMLALLDGRVSADSPVYPGERLVPIYVPLKVLDNSIRHPISTHISKEVRYFSGRRGRRRLWRLAKRRKLMLFLDGYDEILIFQGVPNFVAEEIELLLGAQPLPGELPASTRDIVEALRRARIWVASRREFFSANRFEVGRPNVAGFETTKLLEITGIGSNRAQLVAKIFEKYKRTSENARNLLDHENFILDIDESRDPELVALSENPLFLTMMAYIYVQNVLDSGELNFSWANSPEELVDNCLRLLLTDLDEKKTRGLGVATRKALQRRRGENPEAKLKFLPHFAAELYTRSKSVFTLDEVAESARSFFRSRPEIPGAAKVLDELSDSTRSGNIATQLKENGIFVLIERGVSGDYFDFPHRRFREVLAAKAVLTPRAYFDYLASTRSLDTGELEIVLRKSKSFQSEDLQIQTLELLLEECKRSPGLPVVQMLRTFARLSPCPSRVKSRIVSFLVDQISSASPRFSLPLEVIRELDDCGAFPELARSRAQVAIADLDASLFRLCVELRRVLTGAEDRDSLRSALSIVEPPIPWELALGWLAALAPEHLAEECLWSSGSSPALLVSFSKGLMDSALPIEVLTRRAELLAVTVPEAHKYVFPVLAASLNDRPMLEMALSSAKKPLKLEQFEFVFSEASQGTVFEELGSSGVKVLAIWGDVLQASLGEAIAAALAGLAKRLKKTPLKKREGKVFSDLAQGVEAQRLFAVERLCGSDSLSQALLFEGRAIDVERFERHVAQVCMEVELSIQELLRTHAPGIADRTASGWRGSIERAMRPILAKHRIEVQDGVWVERAIEAVRRFGPDAPSPFFLEA